MSSSTTNLGLTKPVHGEMNWDATMNGNLDAIDAIFSGGGGKLDPTRLPADDATGGGGVALPDQTGNAGKFLKTDGSAVSWDNPGGSGTLPSWLANQTATPPASPNADDDEFSDGVVDAAWTQTNISPVVLTEVNDYLEFSHPGASGDNVHYISKALPASGSWTYETRLGIDSNDNNYYSVGLVLAESGSGKLVTFGFGHIGAHQLQAAYWNSYNSWGGEIQRTDLPFLPEGVLRITWDGAGYRFRFSPTGRGWVTQSTQGGGNCGGHFTAAPDRIGLCMSNNNGSYGLAAYFEHFRRIS